MKVLVIGPTCDGQDIGESWLAHQWVTLLATRFDVTLLTSFKRGHRAPSTQLPSTVRVIEWSEPPLVGRFERFNSLLQPAYVLFHARARRWIRERLASGETFDIAHQVVPASLRYPSPAAGLGIPLVLGPVGGSLESPPGFVPEEGAAPWYQRLRRVDRWRLRHDPLLVRSFESAACVLGNAPYVAELLAPLSIKRFVVVPDVALHGLPPEVDRSGRRGPVRLLHVGRLIRTKGLRDAIRALGNLRDLDVVLDAVGDGNDRAACEALVRALGLTDRVRFHGRVPREAVDAFYREADLFVFPSYREPGGAVVLEAMSFGLPVVVCRGGGPAANVHDSCAVTVSAVSPAQLADDLSDAIRRLVEDEGRRLRMGAAARRHVAGMHLWPRRLDSVGAVYETVAATS